MKGVGGKKGGHFGLSAGCQCLAIRRGRFRVMKMMYGRKVRREVGDTTGTYQGGEDGGHTCSLGETHYSLFISFSLKAVW